MSVKVDDRRSKGNTGSQSQLGLLDYRSDVSSETILGKYDYLPIPPERVLATYVWIDGTGEHLRSKDRTLNYVPRKPKDKLTRVLEEMDEKLMKNAENSVRKVYAFRYLHFHPNDLEFKYQVQCKIRAKDNKDSFDENLKDLPIWSYDGSVSGQANRNNSDILLVPRAVYRDPFRRGQHLLVMCDTYDSNMEPTETNHRIKCQEAYEKCADAEPWFGIDQEYVLLDRNMWPAGWPQSGFPQSHGSYYCGVGLENVAARDLVSAHYKCCLYAGITFGGTVAREMPSQWQFQLGPSVGVAAGDDLWMARFLLHRLAEEYGLIANFDPKPILDYKGSGACTNFSTRRMREEEGILEIENAIDNLSKVHTRHIQVYDPHGGKDNRRRLTGLHGSSKFNQFGVDVASRGSSIRIRRKVAELRRGYLEDRRPSSNCDPYLVINAIMRTCILNE